MVNLDEARKGAPRWRPSHEFLTSQLKEHRQQALARRYNIDIKPIQTEELPDNKHITCPQCHVCPRSGQQGGTRLILAQ